MVMIPLGDDVCREEQGSGVTILSMRWWTASPGGMAAKRGKRGERRAKAGKRRANTAMMSLGDPGDAVHADGPLEVDVKRRTQVVDGLVRV
jgi:hypothetical protein